ncbi:MAG: pyridoxamine 5'-phosphate oxidase family protein [Pseudomonadales bacterium]
MTEQFNYDDVSHYTLDDPDIRALIEAQNECTFMWSTKEGWPVGVIMSYVFKDDCFWLSVSSLRVRVQAVERDPRASISITSKGSSLPIGLSLTYKGLCQVHSDHDTIDWFLPALAKRLRRGEEAQQIFVELNNTANRRVIQFTPTKTIGFDGRKMGKATMDAVGADVLGTRRES